MKLPEKLSHICMLKWRQINRANLVDSNMTRSEIIEKQTHFHDETSHTLFFIDESVVQTWEEWCPKACTPHSADWRMDVAFLFSCRLNANSALLSPSRTVWQDLIRYSFRRAENAESTVHFPLHLSTAPFPNIFKLLIHTAQISNKTIVDAAWDIKTYNGNCPIGTKNNDCPYVMVVFPSIKNYSLCQRLGLVVSRS